MPVPGVRNTPYWVGTSHCRYDLLNTVLMESKAVKEPDTTAPATRKSVSAFVICMNEERNIRCCLESIKWCDEIVIVDSGSTDETLSICREYTDRIFERNWPGFVEQKRFALGQCTHDWVLNIDADEEVSFELRDELLEVLSADLKQQVDYSGYQLLRVVFYLNRWWRKGGWFPEFRLRFFRRKATSWGGEDPHEKALVSGKVTRLRGELRHYTYADMSQHARSLNLLSSVAAASMHSRGETSTLVQMLLNPLFRFFKFYVLKKGFLEGLPGLIVAFLEGHYVFLKYVKLWELERTPRDDDHQK